jgi:hypothetical protein
MFKVRPAKRRAMSLAGLISPKAVWGQCTTRRLLTHVVAVSHVHGKDPVPETRVQKQVDDLALEEPAARFRSSPPLYRRYPSNIRGEPIIASRHRLIAASGARKSTLLIVGNCPA